jgi:hypothetical protein
LGDTHVSNEKECRLNCEVDPKNWAP